MKNLILLFLFINSTYGTEVKWEDLKLLPNNYNGKSEIPKKLKNILNTEIKVKGFMMPLEYDSKRVSEFLLMPYIPACMHVPPPPPNNLIYVKTKKGITMGTTFYPVEITGILKVDSNKELESGYKMEGLKIKELKNQMPAQLNPF